MLGAITGDVIGSVYEWNNIKTTQFNLYNEKSFFTDDTVMTIAVAEAIMIGGSFVDSMKRWGRSYPDAGYGTHFAYWLMSDNREPYNSWGNGSAMRVSPVGFAFNTLEEVLEKAKQSAEVTHNHPEGIKGAQATAAAVFMARHGASKQDIKDYVEAQFGYNLSRKLDDIRPCYTFDVSCQGSVPEAIIAFLESTDFESSLRLAVSIGGDTDTVACINGGIAQAYYKSIDKKLISFIRNKLTDEMLEVLDDFNARYKIHFE
ncbi:MAG: ADP-ribosylglycohydrolase [Bacteroidetes bacterium ADurb.Bin408]|nr:MAG: ADP-ribosylglycohydrolase [Bacteroidetes bacterium ADurb.Bin408]